MASIAGTNVLYPAYRNSVIGNTADYSTRVDCDTDTLISFFSDDGTITPAEADVFVAVYDTSLNPSFANRLALGTKTVPTTNTNAAAGVFDAADAVFTGGSVLTGSTSVESYIIAKVISAASATSPLLAHFGSATGLSGGLTPNGADVTVVFNASGIWKF